jgi:hypothetical protein
MSSLLRLSLSAPLCLLATLLPQTAHAQAATTAITATPEARLQQARALYYTPTTSGLKNFHCDVTVDWKDLFSRFGGGDLPSTDPHLLYFNAIKLSLDDNLTGAGNLNWVLPSGTSGEMDDTTAQIHGGMVQMIAGFFQSWNPFVNGSNLPTLSASTTSTPEGDGLIIHAGDASTTVQEHFDKNMYLTEMHVTNPSVDVVARPTFIDTPKGRMLSVLKSEVHQPPTGPASSITMATTYAPVSSYLIPATLTFSVQNVGDFIFKLSACQINPPSPAGGN